MVLFIKKRNPWDFGTALDLRALREIFGEQQVFVVDLLNPNAERRENYVSYGKYKNPLERIRRSLEGNVVHIDNKIIKNICQLIDEENVSLIFTVESDLGNLMREIKKSHPDIRIICQYRDISAQLFADRRKQASWKKPYFKVIETSITIAQERESQKYVDENWVFHNEDARRFRKAYGHDPDAIIPISADPPKLKKDDFQKIRTKDKEKILLFVCSTYYVNTLGILWFYRNVFPELDGSFRLVIPGRGADGLRDKLLDGRIEIAGPVESMDAYYREADIVITPVFEGGGMKTKDVEAVAYGKCIVSTIESFHGIWENIPDTLRNRMLFCSDGASEWIRILNTLISSDIPKHDREEYEWFCENLSYNAHLNAFRRLLKYN